MLNFEWERTPKPWSFKYENILGFPGVHHSIIFSQLMLDILKREQVSVIGLELPASIQQVVPEILEYLPLPVIVHRKSEEGIRSLETQQVSRFYFFAPGDPITEALLFAQATETPVEFVDYPIDMDATPIPFLDPLLVPSIGVMKYVNYHDQIILMGKYHADKIREQFMAQRLQELKEEYEKVAWVGGLAHWHGIHEHLASRTLKRIESKNTDVQDKKWVVQVLHPKSLPYLFLEIPYFVAMFWLLKEKFSHQEALYQLLREALEPYQEKFDETVTVTSLKKILQYSRNLALIDNRVYPSLFNIIEACKGMVDDDYAIEVYRLAVSYPFYPKNLSHLPIIELGHDLDPTTVLGLQLRQRRPQPVIFRGSEQAKTVWDLIRAPPEEKYPGQWIDEWNKGNDLVSYPPEDEYLERFLNHVRRKFHRMLAEERASIEEFQTSLKDGIEWRETVRHIHEGKIYVKELPSKAPFIDTIIMQFVENDLPYEFTMTWYAEHDLESNLSLVSTKPEDLIIGPGIARGKYAGFISVYPPINYVMPIPRGYTDFSLRLIQAAVHSALSRTIGFVGYKPPSLTARAYAKKNGVRILYLPLSAFSRDTIKRVRIFHMLRSRYLREIAKDYIGY